MNWRAPLERLTPISAGFSRTKATILVMAAVAVAGGVAATIPTPGSASESVRLPVYEAMGWVPQLRPAAIYWGVGGALFTRPIAWHRWTATSAAGTSTLWIDTCKPDCATGRYVKYRDTITLSRVRQHVGQPYFSRLTVRYQRSGGTVARTYELGRWGPG